ncbi:MAG: hypothetical protein OEM02_15840 [Desulfobulbaceae bacterium]|nr:hypothetical protein [Desulfobulbaceae bacterium]
MSEQAARGAYRAMEVSRGQCETCLVNRKAGGLTPVKARTEAPTEWWGLMREVVGGMYTTSALVSRTASVLEPYAWWCGRGAQ